MTIRRTIGGLVGVVVLGLVVTCSGCGSGESAELQEIRSMQASLASQEDPEKRREQFRAMREKAEQLPEAERASLRRDGEKMFLGMMEQRMDALFALPPEERNTELDKQIDQMEERRKVWENRGEGERRGNAERGGPNREGNRQGRGGWADMSNEEREQRRLGRLERTTPELRAKFTEYRRLMDERRRERGLPPSPFFGRGRR